MKFRHVPSGMSEADSKSYQGRFLQLTTELGIRHTNQHIGSGLGGNNFQLLVLMGLQHRLVDSRHIQIRITKTGISWGTEFLSQPMKNIRWRLDEAFPAIQAKHKVLAATIEGTLWHPRSYYGSILEKMQCFPGLANYMEGGEYLHDPTMGLHEQLLMAMFITANQAVMLDRNDVSRLPASGRAINNFCPEIILLSVRMNIGIERLIHFNMDEHKQWIPVLEKVNNAVEESR